MTHLVTLIGSNNVGFPVFICCLFYIFIVVYSSKSTIQICHKNFIYERVPYWVSLKIILALTGEFFKEHDKTNLDEECNC